MNHPSVRPPQEWLIDYIRARFPYEGAPQPHSAKQVPIGLWDSLFATAAIHGVAELFYAALPDVEQVDCPDALVKSWHETYLEAQLLTGMRHQLLFELLRDFRSAGIPVLVFKGAALSLWLYPSPELRPFLDLDLLIHFEDLARATRLLEEKGLTRGLERARNFEERYGRSVGYYSELGASTWIDLHWHPVAPMYYRRRIPAGWFWERATEIPTSKGILPTLDPIGQLVLLGAHSGVQHPEARLIWSYDLALVAARYRDTLDWDLLIRAARELGLTQALALSFSRAIESWGAPIPPEVVEVLEKEKVGVLERVAFAVATAPQYQARVLSDGLWQPGLTRKAGFLAGYIFPSPDFLSSRYQVEDRARLVWTYPRLLVSNLGKLTRSFYSAVSPGTAEGARSRSPRT